MRNRKKYSEEWTDVIRPRILKRDNYKCQKCGIKHRSYVLVDSAKNYTLISREEHDEYKPHGANCYRIYLQVAHLNHNTDNNEDSNLLSMCPKCHLKNDEKHRNLMRLAPKKKEKLYSQNG